MAGRRPSTNTGAGNPEMAMMAQAMAEMADVVAQQTTAKNQRDLQKQQREERNTEAKGLVDFRCHDPPKFRGDVDPEKADLWLQEIEKIFEVLHTPAEVKVSYATYLLLGDAEYWWRSTRLMMEANNQEITWETFREKFLDKYFPISARTKLGDDFLKVRQGNMTIGEYAAKFESLSRYFRFFRQTVDEGYMCHRFMEGLRYEIQDSVLPLGIQQFQPLVEKCREVEAMKNRRLNRGGGNSGGPIRHNNQNQGRGRQNQKPYSRPQGETKASIDP